MNIPMFTVAYVAETDLPARTIVAHGSDANMASLPMGTSSLLGVTILIDTAAGQHVDVIRAGFAPVVYGSTISRGQPVTTDSNYRAVAALPGQMYIGFAEEDGEEGDLGSIFVTPGYVPNNP